MVTTSEVAVSVTIDNGSQLKYILKELEPFGTTEVEEGPDHRIHCRKSNC